MLNLYTSGYGYSKRRCSAAVEWFIHKYLPRHHITLEVLHRGLKRDSVVGWCDIEGRTYNPRSFLIELQSSMNPRDYLRTLFHELWHVYQFVTGDLRVKSSKPYYKGICIENVDYEHREHEKEAFSMESKLLHEYLTDTHQSL